MGDDIISDQVGKEPAFHRAYTELIGMSQARQHALNLKILDLYIFGLEEQQIMFTEEEVWSAVNELPTDRAPGPDGSIGLFYHKAWEVIKRDIMAAIHKLFVADGRGFAKFNHALITLIPKKPDALEVCDYHPISLVHSFPKLVSKLLAIRLRPRMGELVNVNQSAFIRGRNLHDNFILVRQMARQLHQWKAKGVLLMLDISRAFDSISWPFLFEILRAKGFSERWLAWVIILLNSASSRVVVKILHVRGL